MRCHLALSFVFSLVFALVLRYRTPTRAHLQPSRDQYLAGKSSYHSHCASVLIFFRSARHHAPTRLAFARMLGDRVVTFQPLRERHGEFLIFLRVLWVLRVFA